ncbi:MAG: alpha-1,2-fucosyltransferase, partial [Spirochaetes bacterium]|nr:alpha-1,2-fucosyltransferase [Spirochaetota bacterium]
PPPPPRDNKQNIYVGGWFFRVHELTAKYQDYFIAKYTLKEKYYKDNNYLKIINKQKENGNIIIGIHIRRGDYKQWNEGKYFFDDNVYLKYKQNMKNEIESKLNKQCKIIFFSNEPLSFVEDENTYISKNDWYIDQFLMSKCDFLIGPPSTFTLWASYIGKVKYYHIENNNGIINLNNFLYCKG